MNDSSGTAGAPGINKRIAVVVVHGVADQQPGESSAAIASMLIEHTSAGADSTYTPFTAREVHFPQHPVIPASSRHANAEPTRRNTLWTLRSRRDYLDAARDGGGTVEASGTRDASGTRNASGTRDADGELGYQFMRMQLREHEADGESRALVTSVLQGRRRRARPEAPAVEVVQARVAGTTPAPPTTEQPPTAGERDVDIYELHWADLSRPAQGALGFFGTAYQLLLHVGTLGRQAVDDATSEHRSWPWRALRVLQRTAVAMLTLPIAMLNVILLVVGFGVIPIERILGFSWGAAVALGLVAGFGGAAIAYVIGRRVVPSRPIAWSLYPFLCAVLGVFLSTQALGRGWISDVGAISVAWWVAGAAVVLWIASRYQRLRAGAFVLALVAYVASALIFLYWMRMGSFPEGTGELARMQYATLWTMQAIFAGLRLSWIVLVLSAALLVVGWFAARFVTRHDPAGWARGRAALRTGRLALGLAAGAFLIFTIIAWAGIFSFSVSRFDVFSSVQSVTVGAYPAPVRWLIPDVEEIAALDRRASAQNATRTDSVGIAAREDAAALTVPEYFQGMITQSITATAPISVALQLLALLLLVWMALPSIRAEGDADRECTNKETRRMGRWLSRGLDSTRWVTHLIYASLLAPLVFQMIVRTAHWFPWNESVTLLYERLLGSTYQLVGTFAALIASSAIILIGVIVKFGGSALDVMLDVDNYLRTTPAESTPRARICQRYVSLLRHIASDGPDSRRRYDGLVIVAHSLGGLITADLLRFLTRERERGGDPSLARLGFGRDGAAEIPITLFTMGNPLRQLLTRFFPHRYRWVRSEPDNGSRPLPNVDAPGPASADMDRPDTHWLGVRRWENAYRSGDYVGRSLWLEEWYARNMAGDEGGKYGSPLTCVIPPSGSSQMVEVREYCIGAGAHTHYWDMSARDVADRIDALIAEADAGRPARAAISPPAYTPVDPGVPTKLKP